MEVVLANDSPQALAPGTAVLAQATLSSWNAAVWPYPAVPPVPLPGVGPGATATASFVLDWAAPGWASWWWPNRPFNETYLAQLHWLNATLEVGGVPASTASQRFGVVDHAEGATYYYTLNGVRLNQLSDATPENGSTAAGSTPNPLLLPPPHPAPSPSF